jgi:hypothetical protein
MKFLRALLVVLLLAETVNAAPVITATSGTIATGNSLSVFGTGFPSKSGTAHLWADGQQGSVVPNTSLSDTLTLRTENATYESGSDKRWGVGAFRSAWVYGAALSSQRAFTLRPNALSITYGSEFTISWWEKTDITSFTPDNWKIGVRWWQNSTAGGFPNHYVFSLAAGSGSSSNIRANIENPTFSFALGGAYGFPNSTWRRITILYRMNSALGVADGSIRIYKNNALINTTTGLQFNNAANPNFAPYAFFQAVIANAAVPNGTNFWFSDLYLDPGFGRFEVCDASTYASSTQCEIQPFTGSNATSATLNLHLGTLSGSKYLYIFDDNNNVNAAGFLLQTGSSPSPTPTPTPTPTPNPPPFIVSLSPPNGSAAGNTLVTLTATGLIDTPEVKVNGVDATNETFISSTQMTFRTPAGTGGTTGPVTVFNPDTQNYTLLPGFSYDPAASTINPVTEVFPWIQENP